MAGPERVRKPIASNLQSTIRDLQRRKARGRRGLALIEGVRLVEEALAAGLTFRGALVAPDLARTTRGRELVVELERHAVPVEEGSARALAEVADTEAPQGIVAVVEPRTWAADDIPLGGCAARLWSSTACRTRGTWARSSARRTPWVQRALSSCAAPPTRSTPRRCAPPWARLSGIPS